MMSRRWRDPSRSSYRGGEYDGYSSLEGDYVRPSLLQRSPFLQSVFQTTLAGVVGILVLLLVFVLLVVGLVIHKYWDSISFVVFILLLIFLACTGVCFLAGTVWVVAQARMRWKVANEPAIQVVESHVQRPVVALRGPDGKIEWRPPPPMGNLQALTVHGQVPALPPGNVTVQEAPPSSLLPVAERTARELLPLLHLHPGELLLGYSKEGEVWVPVENLLSTLIVGNSKRGKSRGLMWLLAQILLQGGSAVILDGKREFVQVVGDLVPCAWEQTGLFTLATYVRQEAEWRLDQPLGTKFPALMVIADEWDLLIGELPELVDLAAFLIRKARSVNVHLIFVNQSLSAEEIGGVKTRGVIVSRLILYCHEDAARMAGIRKGNGQEKLDLIKPPAPQGLAVAQTELFDWTILRFPQMEYDDLRWAAEAWNRWMQQQPKRPGAPAFPFPLPVGARVGTPPWVGREEEEEDALPPDATAWPPQGARAGAGFGAFSPSLSRQETVSATTFSRVVVLSEEEKRRERVLQAWRAHPDYKPYELCDVAGINHNKWRWVKQVIEEEQARLAAEEGIA